MKVKGKRKGSMLLECMLCIFIISIVIVSFVASNKEDYKSFNLRNEIRENTLLMNNIVNEIKFNTTIEELENKLKVNKIVIGVGENIFNDLKTKDILNIQNNYTNKKIIIEKINGSLEKINLKVSFIEDENEILEEEVEKEIWMEEK